MIANAAEPGVGGTARLRGTDRRHNANYVGGDIGVGGNSAWRAMSGCDDMVGGGGGIGDTALAASVCAAFVAADANFSVSISSLLSGR